MGVGLALDKQGLDLVSARVGFFLHAFAFELFLFFEPVGALDFVAVEEPAGEVVDEVVPGLVGGAVEPDEVVAVVAGPGGELVGEAVEFGAVFFETPELGEVDAADGEIDGAAGFFAGGAEPAPAAEAAAGRESWVRGEC